MCAAKFISFKGFMPKIVFVSMLIFVASGANAATTYTRLNGANSYNYDCDSLYSTDVADSNDKFGYSNQWFTIYKVNLDSNGNFIGRTALYRNTVERQSTIALGPWGEENGTLTMLHWYWGSLSFTSESYYPNYIRKNQANDNAPHINPLHLRPTLGGWDYYSGGEFNQLSGEIYFGGGELCEFDSCYEMLIYKPNPSGTGAVQTRSGRIQPLTTTNCNNDPDADSNWCDNVVNGGYISSDMAIDADGNAYVLVNTQDSANGIWFLVKVIPGGNATGWKYSIVQKIGKAFRDDFQYGMAFINGKLYTASIDNYLYKLDPLDGTIQDQGRVGDPFDLASCQVAPIISGKVYYDANGDGILSSVEKNDRGVANVIVQVYNNSGTLLGQQVTNINGEYSLLMPLVVGSTTTYYIRLKQPQINGSNAHQTWASGGRYEWKGYYNQGNNTIEPVCYNDISLSNKQNSAYNQIGKYSNNIYDYYEVSCYGTKKDGIDTSANSTNNANYYTKVTMQTDRAVARADFALGPIDRGDAPASYGDASHSMIQSDLKIGDKIDPDTMPLNDANALGDDNNNEDDEDGVEIEIPSEDGLSATWMKLDNQTFRNKVQLFTRVPYRFRVKVSEGGYLNAWTHISNVTGDTTKFTELMNYEHPDLQDGGAGDGDGVKNGEIIFTYVIPRHSSLKTISNIYFRFRYDSVGNNNISGTNPSRDHAWWNNHPWVVNGEVEDYTAKYDPVAVPFYCNVLYATSSNGTVNAFKNPSSNTDFIDPEYYFMFNRTAGGSLAIGRYLDKITMFHWSYYSNQTVQYVHSKESNVDNITAPLLAGNSNVINNPVNYWSGGAMHPANGTIYMNGYVNTTLHNSPYMNILKYPVGGVQGKNATAITPLTPSDQVNGNISSDVFLGSDGGIYILAEDGANYNLLRINPTDWKYSKVTAIKGDLSKDKQVYGLAFFNGKAYATTIDSELYEIDPMTGDSRKISGSVWNKAYYDLATCQVAPTVQGTLYFDKNADGSLSEEEKSGVKLANVTVQVYDKNHEFLIEQKTDSNGRYSFILNQIETDSTFYIRVKEPFINSVRAVQTWASGDATSKVMRVCDNENLTSSGKCYGVNGPLGSEGSDNNLSKANYYSIVKLENTPMALIDVDFAFSGIDRSDTPSRYGEVYHTALRDIIRLGDSVTSDIDSIAGEDANVDDSDDGVRIKEADSSGNYQPLQGFKLKANTNYTIEVKPNGNMSQEGYLNAWISLHKIVGKTPDWMVLIHNQSNIPTNTPVHFNYTTPMSMFGDEDIYFRFRFSLEETKLKTNNHNDDSYAWNIGEVEDYKVRVENNNPRPLEEIFNEILYGDIKIIGNTVMGRKDTNSDNATCPIDATDNNDNNNIDNTRYWRVNSAAKVSSSTARLDIPMGAKVKAAFLRWQGANIRNVIDYRRAKTITLTTPSGSYDIKADDKDMNWYDHAYQGMANITDKVTSSGDYGVSGIFTSFDKDSYGVWSIIVVYDNVEDGSEVLRKAVIYDGFTPVNGGNTQQIEFEGFKTSSRGDVDSKMFLFAGEGDKGKDDGVLVNNIRIDGNDPIDSTITDFFGSNVINRNPDCLNNLGADIHTYNIGTSGAGAIKNNEDKAMAQFTSTDVYYLGLVGFSIQLYEPRVCYYIDSIVNLRDGTDIFSNGTFGENIFSEEQEYGFALFIANMQDKDNSVDRDIAHNVQAHMSYMKPDQLNYTLDTTSIDNIGGGPGHITDALDSDLGEYDNTSYKHNWRLGRGADASKGGTFYVSDDLNAPEKAKIELKMYLGKLDASASEKGVDLTEYLRFQASYNSEISNVTRTKDIDQCRPMELTASADPIIDSFNVVNENFADDREWIRTDKDHADNALYTQVAGQSFDVKLVALKDVGAISGTLDLVSYNTNRTVVSLDLIEGADYDMCAYNAKDKKEIEECCSKQGAIASSLSNFTFSQDENTTGIKRITVETNRTVSYGKFRINWYKAVGEMTPRYSCSVDRFAIRPANFKIEHSGSALIGGVDNNVTIKAVGKDGVLPLWLHNQTASEMTYDNTSSLVIPSGCNEDDINSTIDNTTFWVNHDGFIDGTANMRVKYNNVGNISAIIVDSNWTHVDQVKYDGYTDKYDCEQNSSINMHNFNKRVGCNIVSDDAAFRFIHDHFDANVTMKNTHGGNFTYLSNSADMAVEVTTNLIAMLGDNTSAINYHKSCYADDVTYGFDLINDDLAGYENRSKKPKERIVFFGNSIANVTNNNSAGNGKGDFNISESNFGNGAVNNIQFGLNFGRDVHIAENPFIAYTGDFNVSYIGDSDVSEKTVDLTADNITLFYGRAFIKNYKGPSPIDAKVEYERFCQGCNSTLRALYSIELIDMNQDSNEWWINRLHDGTNYGQVHSYDANGDTNVSDAASAPLGGYGNITLTNDSGYTPYMDTIHAFPDGWLIHNPHNPLANEIDFTVEFLGGSGGWAGKGQVEIAPSNKTTGGVIGVTPDNKTRSRANW